MDRSESVELVMEKEEEEEEEGEGEKMEEKEEEQEEEEEEEDEEDEIPARALALEMDISASPAFQCLDEMFSSGQVSATKVAKLKASYQLLRDTLRRALVTEDLLLQEAQGSRAMLKELREQAEEAEEEQVAPSPPADAEATRLRRQLLQAHNDVELAQNRECTRRYTLQRLLEEKLCWEKECAKYKSKPASLDALREKREELTKEVAQRRLEVRDLNDQMQAVLGQTLQQQKELDEKKEVIEKTQAEMAQLVMAPIQLLKEMDRVQHRKADAGRKVASLEAEVGALTEHLTEAERRHSQLEKEKSELLLGRMELGARLEAAALVHREGLKARASAKEKELYLLGERDIQGMKVIDLVTDSRLLNESQYIQLRERDRQIRTSKQMELLLQQATDQLLQTQSLHNKTKAQRDVWLKGDGVGGVAQRKAELQRDVDALKANLKHQLDLFQDEGQLEQQGSRVQALLRESGALRSDLHSLGRLTHIKADERDQKHRQLRKAEQARTLVEQERREKDLVIMDLHKLQSALQHRLSERAEAYNLLQAETQRALAQRDLALREVEELVEKGQALEKEVEILNTAAVKKDRTMVEARKIHSHGRAQQESLSKDISKVDRRLREAEDRSEERAATAHALKQAGDEREQELLALTRSYHAATHRRKTLSLQLLECEAEGGLLQQGARGRAAALDAGGATLDALEEHARTLRVDAAEERRCVALETDRAAQAHVVEAEFAALWTELLKARAQTSVLAEELSLSGDPSSVFKELLGPPAPGPELIEKARHLEDRIMKCEEQLMEKELLLDQVTRLSQPIRDQLENGQQERLQMAKKLNSLRSQSTGTNQRLMAVAAELSMRQAQALALEQEVRERKEQVEECERRLAQGVSPGLEVEEEWRRLLRDRRRRQKEAQEREEREGEEAWNQLPGGVFTTAEPRPNAYIPSQARLPLPRPYGAPGPFKPTEPGANMRHIRKPRLKPIEK
ncbi:unnamed protein product [Arctogadus glacialis]